jgi:hypothetical protein
MPRGPRIALVANPGSRAGDPGAVAEGLRELGAEVQLFEIGEAERAAAAGADRVVVAGGDGSIARAAAAAGVRILVNSDAHSARNLGLIEYGIATARRAWLTAEQVANTRPWAEFAPLRKRAAA